MAIKKINPYLNFDEETRQRQSNSTKARSERKTRERNALRRCPGYRRCAGSPGRVLHAALSVGQGVVMLSDTMPGMSVAKEATRTSALDFDDAADMTKRFEALSAGGTVTMPLQDTFWGARFGMLADAFGIKWMFNCELKKS